MKRAVSVSIGSSKRDKVVEIELLGEKVRLERIGTDGSLEKAAKLFEEMDGKVDAFGVGGTNLGSMVGDWWVPLKSIAPMVRGVRKTPIVDGTGLKVTSEGKVAQAVEGIVDEIGEGFSRKAMFTAAIDRWGTVRSFLDAGYECCFCDFMFGLGIPIPVYTERMLMVLARILLPIVFRLPFHWIYPTGEAQEEIVPKWGKYYQWASVIAGDCHYILHNMPPDLSGKVIVTNTTTVEDRDIFKKAGVKYLVTTTPILEGRSFGTNMMEAALVAASGRTEPVDYANPGTYFEEIEKMVGELGFQPQVQEL